MYQPLQALNGSVMIKYTNRRMQEVRFVYSLYISGSDSKNVALIYNSVRSFMLIYNLIIYYI